MMRTRLACLLLTFLFVPTTYAANGRHKEAEAAPPPLGMVTGPKTGTYIAIGRDIAAVAKEEGVEVEVKESDGSIDNIKRINSKENAGLGIVQSDVLGFLARSKNPDTVKIASNLRMVLPLYKEEVHVLARKNIKQFSDLKGKRVVVGEEGSGQMLTAVNILALMDMKVDGLRMNAPQGVVAVLQGEADAIIFVGGKPVKLFKNLEDLSTPENQKYAELLGQVHFLPMKEVAMLEEYPTAEITKDDYSFVSETIPTIAVTAVLVSFDFASAQSKEKQARCEQIRALSTAVRDRIDQLRTGGHPKWKEVDLNAELGFWKRDRCSFPGGKTPAAVQRGRDLLDIIGKGAIDEKAVAPEKGNNEKGK